MNEPPRSEERIPILFFGNLPPPYGGISSHFAFMVPRLLEIGFVPIILLREAEDYSAWREMGAFIYRLPHTPEDQAREVEAFQARVPSEDLERCLAVGRRMGWLLEQERFLSDVGFAYRIAVRHNVQLVHTFHTYHRSVAALAVNQLLHRPLLLTILGEVVSDFGLRPELHASLRWFFEQFDAILATSKHCASGMRLIGMDASAVHVIPYGVNLQFFREVDAGSLRQLHRLEDKRVVLFQGRISPEKGPDVLLEALPTVVRDVPGVIVLFVGPDEGPGYEGPTGLAATLQHRVEALGLGQHVRFVGAVPFEELPAYFSLADLLVFPSTSAKECMGLSIKEALACGRPVIVARAGGACEAIEHAVSGYCVNANDPTLLARTLTSMLTSASLAQMGKAAQQRARDIFSETKTLDAVVSLYHRVLDGASGKPETIGQYDE